MPYITLLQLDRWQFRYTDNNKQINDQGYFHKVWYYELHNLLHLTLDSHDDLGRLNTAASNYKHCPRVSWMILPLVKIICRYINLCSYNPLYLGESFPSSLTKQCQNKPYNLFVHLSIRKLRVSPDSLIHIDLINNIFLPIVRSRRSQYVSYIDNMSITVPKLMIYFQ